MNQKYWLQVVVIQSFKIAWGDERQHPTTFFQGFSLLEIELNSQYQNQLFSQQNNAFTSNNTKYDCWPRFASIKHRGFFPYGTRSQVQRVSKIDRQEIKLGDNKTKANFD